MKSFFGLVAAALLLNVNSANAAVATAVADAALAQETVQAVQVFKTVVTGGIKTPAELVGKQIAGSAITAAEAPALFAMVSPLVAAFNAQNGVKAADINPERLAALANAANLKPTAAISAMTETLTASGNLSEQNLEAAFAAASKNVANLLPGKLSGMNPSEVMASYVATTADVQGVMSESASVEEMNTQAEILKTALIDAPAVACQGLTPAACAQVSDRAAKNAESAIVKGYTRHGKPFANFFYQAHTNFSGEAVETGAQPADYIYGYGNALEVTGPADGSKVTPASKDLFQCLVGSSKSAAESVPAIAN